MIKKILNINDTLSFGADENNYVVVVLKMPGQKEKYAQHLYCPTIADCAQTIYEIALRKNLTKKLCADIREVLQIVLDTQKELREIFAPFIQLAAGLKARENPAEGGGGGFVDQVRS
jgi:uncharacterized protein YceH (UPF0502 family)